MLLDNDKDILQTQKDYFETINEELLFRYGWNKNSNTYENIGYTFYVNKYEYYKDYYVFQGPNNIYN